MLNFDNKKRIVELVIAAGAEVESKRSFAGSGDRRRPVICLKHSGDLLGRFGANARHFTQRRDVGLHQGYNRPETVEKCRCASRANAKDTLEQETERLGTDPWACSHGGRDTRDPSARVAPSW